MRWMVRWAALVLAACSGGGGGATASTADTAAHDVTGDWSGTCVEDDGTEWSLTLSFVPRPEGDWDTDWTLTRVVSIGDPSFVGTGRSGWEDSVLMVGVGVMPYTTGYVLDVNLDLALTLTDEGALTGAASSFFEAVCTVR